MRPRRNKALEQELADSSHFLRAWHRHHREVCDAALAGPSGALVEQLLEILGKLTLRDGAALIAFVRSQDWHAVDPGTRYVCLHAIDGAVAKLREKAGMTPFDDALEGAPATVFQVVKQMMETA